ncbi:MAG: hypothetical protein ACKO0Z_13090, partial [Betaproteobacteria bacterium]
SSSMVSDRNRTSATLRTKIAQSYVSASDLQVQAYSGADRYVTHGFLPIRVNVDYDRQTPIIQMLDPIGCYPVQDSMRRTVALFQRTMIDRDELAAQYPKLSRKIKDGSGVFGSRLVEVVFYHDKNWDLAFIAGTEAIMLDATPNPLGKCMVEIAERPGPTDVPRGQFDDVLFVQLAKSSMALLALQAAHDAVNAPIVVPTDVPEIPYGPGATIRTNNPQGVGRIRQELPQAAFAEQQSLDRELQLGARFPEVRTGNAGTSQITGKGVQALMGGYDSQIRGHQAIFARTIERVIALCFEVDEKIFGDKEKTVHSAMSGVSFALTYTPAKAIKGDYTVQAKYGLMSGLDPNGAMVFGLQGLQAKLFSRDFLRREMPFDLDVEDQARSLDIEDLEDAAKQALMATAQAIPQLVAQGQDPTKILTAFGKAAEMRAKGQNILESITEAFKPEPAPAPAATPEGGAPGMPSPEEALNAMTAEQSPMAAQGAPSEPVPAEGGAPVAAAPAGGAPGGLTELLASLSSSGGARITSRSKSSIGG